MFLSHVWRERASHSAGRKNEANTCDKAEGTDWERTVCILHDFLGHGSIS